MSEPKSRAVNADTLPAVGPRRFWTITHAPKSRTKPVRIELRESEVEGRKVVSLSRLLGFEFTVADPDAVLETARIVEARVGRIDDVVGTF